MVKVEIIMVKSWNNNGAKLELVRFTMFESLTHIGGKLHLFQCSGVAYIFSIRTFKYSLSKARSISYSTPHSNQARK